MRRFPILYRVLIDVLREERIRRKLKKEPLSKSLKAPGNYIQRIEALQVGCDISEYVAIARQMGAIPSVLIARAEKRIKAIGS